jgi:hypothetical protein
LRRSDRLRTFEADYGRDFGWFVETGGATVVALVDPQRVELFWYSYRVEPVEGTALPEAVFAASFWHEGGLVFRNRSTGEVARNAFAGGETPTRERPRLLMRGLSTSLQPTLIERMILWYRRRRCEAER